MELTAGGAPGSKKPSTEGVSTSAAGSSASQRLLILEPPLPLVVHTTNLPAPTSGDEPPPPGKKLKKCTSDVWQYFTKKKVVIEDNGKTYEQVWAHLCESNYGTTGFWTHLRVTHSIVKGQQQLKAETDNKKGISTVVPYKYDEEANLRKFYLAIVMHEYPFNISEHEYFVEFIKSLRPSFPIKSRVTIRKEIMSMFLKEKDQLYAYFKSSYMCVTLHWIDDNWCIQKRIVNFVHVDSHHTGTKLSETFTELMVKWYVDKRLFALTLDNASANEVAVKDIIADLRANASASSLNIRQVVLAVKGSPLQWEELMKRATKCGLDTNKGLSLDVSTRWNSTYLMLRDALYYKNAYMRLKSSDCRRHEKITPSPNEWTMAFKLFQCLKKFFDLIELFSDTLYPTANLLYRGFCEIKIPLGDWSISENTTTSAMATSMIIEVVEFYMRKFYGNACQVHVDELIDVIKKLYQFYAAEAPSSSRAKSGSNEPREIDTADLLVDTGDEELESFLYETNGANGDDMNELEKYMADPPLRLSGQFDILAWWKNQTDEYPILAKIARDLLAVQVSTVASESAFSAGGRVVDPFCSHLDPEMVEALICIKDWVAAGRRDKKVGSIVGDLEVSETLASKLNLQDDDVADSDREEVDGPVANDGEFYDY
ncbi:hypothetical protein PVAP13_6KG109972 [Panicum virgatum]|uniref:HAT C-terminal dimerisation domain-containing protein n=1 Tax=Panicum virgatum TaxID=38727 RepID=A0A8T0R9K0_PANVG|nr:hypothetical protein PVAP13_6KG109972 [Panicum virgatum]